MLTGLVAVIDIFFHSRTELLLVPEGGELLPMWFVGLGGPLPEQCPGSAAVLLLPGTQPRAPSLASSCTVCPRTGAVLRGWVFLRCVHCAHAPPVFAVLLAFTGSECSAAGKLIRVRFSGCAGLRRLRVNQAVANKGFLLPLPTSFLFLVSQA